MPKLTRVAGFEWGTGFYINPTSPEEAAQVLRVREDLTISWSAKALAERHGLKAGRAVWYVGRSGGNNSVVECDLAKVEVAGSNPVSRSILRSGMCAEDAHRSSPRGSVRRA